MPPFATYLKSDLDTIDYVVTGSPVVAGTPVTLSPGFYGIPAIDAAIGTTVALRVRGIFAIRKVTASDTFAVGTLLEWNGSGLQVGSGSGTFRVMAPCPAGTTKVCVRINVESGSGGGGGGPTSWGFITGTLNSQVDLQSALDGKAATSHVHTFASITSKPTTLSGYGITDGQPLDADLTAIAVQGTNVWGRALLTLSSGDDLAFALGDGSVNLSKLSNASAGSRLLGRRSGATGGVWEEITFGSGLTMSNTGVLSATGGGGGGSVTPPGVVKIKCTGALSTDNAAITAGVAEAIAFGDGVEIQLCPSDDGVHRELNSSVDMAFGTLSYSLIGQPGFKGIVNQSTSTTHRTIFSGAFYDPWSLPNPITLPLGMAKNTNVVIDPSIAPTLGKCYAFWSDDENTDIARHEAAKPQRSIELHRISRQVKERVYRLTITGTGGTFTLTGAGATATANISATATASQILSAINAVIVSTVAVNVPAAWRVEQISSGVFRLWTAAGTTNGYAMTVQPAGLTGGSATCALDASFTPINKWEIEDTTFRPFTINPKMVEVPMIPGIRIENVNIRNAAGIAPAGSAIALCGAYKYLIRNCRLGDALGRGNPGELYTRLCYGGVEENVWICDHDDPDTHMSIYYGMLESTSNQLRRIGCTYGAVRHGYTSGGHEQTITGTTYRYGGSLNPVFDSCLFHAGPQYMPETNSVVSAPMWDCHPEISRATVQNSLFLVPANQVGFNARAQGVTLANNTFHCAAGGSPGYVTAPDFTMLGGEIVGGSFAIELFSLINATATANPLRAKFLGVTWRDSWGPVMRIRSGGDIEIDGCKFLRIGGLYTNTPFTESCAIYVEGLYNSSMKLSITNCHAPKHLNKWFLYAPSLLFDQLYYAGNTGMQTYGGTSIGIARLRRSTGGIDPSGAQGSTIPTAVEWEMAYGTLNGHPVPYQYRQKSSHGLTSADKGKPINSNHDVYDNTLDETVNGVLVDIPYEGSTDTDNFYVLLPRGSMGLIPKSLLSGTYSAGTDPTKGWWNRSLAGGAGLYVASATAPVGSHANAVPILDICAFTTNLMQAMVTQPVQAVGGGGGGGSTLLWAEKAW